MGYAGMLKWDCHFGKYDKGTQANYAIGPPGPPAQPRTWQLYPMYFLLRLFTLTTAPGWKVLPITRDPSAAGSGTKHLAAFKGNGKNLTILGLDEQGAHMNKAGSKTASYQIGGLTPQTPFKLVLWNKTDGHKLNLEPTVKANAAGVVTITSVPVHSVFALTTKALPAF